MGIRLKLAGMIAGVLLTGLATSSEAGPLTGAFSITGNFLAVNNLAAPSSLLDATGIDFISFAGSVPTPGVEGDFFVNSAKKDFASLLFKTGKIKDFSFGGGLAFPTTPLIWFQSVGGVTFDLLSIAVVQQTADFLLLSGQGTFSKSGFDPTYGIFNLSANGFDGTYTFSASEGTPEPATLLLLGGGVITAAVARRRQRRRQTA